MRFAPVLALCLALPAPWLHAAAALEPPTLAELQPADQRLAVLVDRWATDLEALEHVHDIAHGPRRVAALRAFHTGWQALVGKDNKRFMAGEPGVGKEGALYLVGKQVVAVGADTWAVEAIPFEKDVGAFEIHQILLAKNGTYILENMDTSELAKDKAWEFMFNLGPSRITGGVQAIINPIAIR